MLKGVRSLELSIESGREGGGGEGGGYAIGIRREGLTGLRVSSYFVRSFGRVQKFHVDSIRQISEWQRAYNLTSISGLPA